MQCHLRPPDVTPLPSEIFLGLRISAADKRNAVSFRFAGWRHGNAACSVCDGWERNRLLRASENSGTIRSRLWTKIHGILGRWSGPPVISNALAPMSTSSFVPKIFVIKSRSRRE